MHISESPCVTSVILPLGRALASLLDFLSVKCSEFCYFDTAMWTLQNTSRIWCHTSRNHIKTRFWSNFSSRADHDLSMTLIVVPSLVISGCRNPILKKKSQIKSNIWARRTIKKCTVGKSLFCVTTFNVLISHLGWGFKPAQKASLFAEIVH